jgi:ribosomal protein L40E
MNDTLEMVSLPISLVEKRSKLRGSGYYEDVMQRGLVEENQVRLSFEDLKALYDKYEKPLLPEEHVEPDPHILLLNFIGAMVDSAKSGFKRTTAEQHEARKQICQGCEMWDPTGFWGAGKCKKCGCSGAKLWLATSKCPLNKWPVLE